MNAVGVKLGNGCYTPEQHGETNMVNENVLFLFCENFSLIIQGPPHLIFTLTLIFENGDQIQVLSDQTWTGREGSIKHDSVYNGEIYDSRNDRPNWARAGFNDSRSAWIMPESLPSPDALHFEVIANGSQQGYLTRDEVGEIKGASLNGGGIIKPIATWLSGSSILTVNF